MTTRLARGLIATAFAIGILTGAAGIIVARDLTTPTRDFAGVMADHMDGRGIGTMPGSMMGTGSFSGAGMMNGPAASSMPGTLHDLHHPSTAPGGVQ